VMIGALVVMLVLLRQRDVARIEQLAASGKPAVVGA